MIAIFSQSVQHVVSFPLFTNTTMSFSTYLKSPHIPRVSCRLQTILVTFQEELQEKPAKVNERAHVCGSASKKLHERLTTFRFISIHVMSYAYIIFVCVFTTRCLPFQHQSQLFRLVLKSMLFHIKSQFENLRRSPVKSPVVFQSKLKAVMYARGLRGLWYPAMLYLNPHMGIERERSRDNYRGSGMRRWQEEGSGRGIYCRYGHAFSWCLIIYVRVLLLVIGCEKERSKGGCW